MMKNKSWTLTPTHTLTLAPPNQRGICFLCHLEKEILIISERNLPQEPNQIWEERKLCWGCSLNDVRKLEESDYPVKNKKEIIKEIREVLNSSPQESEYLDCYE